MIVFNEKKEAEKLLNDNNSLIKLGDLMLLAKYYESMNMNVYNNLKSYILSRTKEYNQVIYDNYIDMAINHTDLYQLRGANKIPITQKELDAILKIDDFKIQRVMFMMIIIAKYYKYNSSNINCKKTVADLYFKNSISDLFKLAKVTYSSKENIRITSALSQLGYVEWFIKGSAKILIADIDGKPVVEFTPDDSIIYYLYQFHNNKVVECEHCHKWLKVNKKTNNIKYCTECSQIINRQKTNKRMKDIRNKSKN